MSRSWAVTRWLFFSFSKMAWCAKLVEIDGVDMIPVFVDLCIVLPVNCTLLYCTVRRLFVRTEIDFGRIQLLLLCVTAICDCYVGLKCCMAGRSVGRFGTGCGLSIMVVHRRLHWYLWLWFVTISGMAVSAIKYSICKHLKYGSLVETLRSWLLQASSKYGATSTVDMPEA